MKKAPRVFSNTLDASKAAAFYDRMHALKGALEALQAQYTADLAEVVEEASEALSVDPGLFRMAFTQERQKREREAKIAKMEGYKAVQLDLLGDAACGSDGLSRRVPEKALTLSSPEYKAAQKAKNAETRQMVDELAAKAPKSPKAQERELAGRIAGVLSDIGCEKTGSNTWTAPENITAPAAPPPAEASNEIPPFLDRRNRPQKLAVA